MSSASRELLPLRPQDIACQDHDDWLQQRGRAIGASETPSILGVGYAALSAFTVWHQKVHPEERADIDDGLLKKMALGTMMEPVIRDLFRKETGIQIEPDLPYTIRVHPQCSFISATLDGLLHHDEHGLCVAELKNIGAHAASDWKDDAVPLKYEVQLQQQLAVTGCEWGVLVALIGGDTPLYRWRQRNDRFIAAMQQQLERFWNYVVTEIQPPLDESKANGQLLQQLHPDDDGSVVPMPDGAAMWDIRRNEMKALKKFAEKRVEYYDNLIKVALGDSTYGLLPDGSCYSWKTKEREAGVRRVKAGKYRTLLRHNNLPKDVIYLPPTETAPTDELAGLIS